MLKTEEIFNKRVSDNEIIKALERMSEEDPNGFSSDILDLINRKNAEIERLRNASGLMQYFKKAVHRVEIDGKAEVVEYASEEALYDAITKRIYLMSNVQTSMTEAYKEFAERLTDRISDKLDRSLDNPDGNNYSITDVFVDINDLLAKMDGGKE